MTNATAQDNAIDLQSVISSYNVRLYNYSSWNDEAIDDVSGINCGDLRSANELDSSEVQLVGHTLLAFGDYCNATLVEKSNIQWFETEFADCPGVHTVYDSYSYRAIAIEVQHLTQEMVEAIASLDDYCVLDEDLHSEMEMEAEYEAWDSWVKADFIRAIEKRFKCELTYEAIASDAEPTSKNFQTLEELFHQCCEWSNTNGYNENSDDWYIDIDRVVKCELLDMDELREVEGLTIELNEVDDGDDAIA